MKDISGRELKNRGIVLAATDLYGLQFAIIDNLTYGNDQVEVILVFKDQQPQLETINSPTEQLFIVSHRQLPSELKEKLIEYSEIRIMGPEDREAFHKKINCKLGFY